MYRAKRTTDIEWDLAADVVAWKNECEKSQIQRDQLLKAMREVRHFAEVGTNNPAQGGLCLVFIKAQAKVAIENVEGVADE